MAWGAGGCFASLALSRVLGLLRLLPAGPDAHDDRVVLLGSLRQLLDVACNGNSIFSVSFFFQSYYILVLINLMVRTPCQIFYKGTQGWQWQLH